MHYEGPRRQGRFIKKGSRVLDKVALVEFSFKEIDEGTTVPHDNSRRTIIHSHYHELKELEGGVRRPPRFNEDLVAPNEKRPLMMPKDFTADWERDRMLRKDRVMRQDDDDEFETEGAAVPPPFGGEPTASAETLRAPAPDPLTATEPQAVESAVRILRQTSQPATSAAGDQVVGGESDGTESQPAAPHEQDEAEFIPMAASPKAPATHDPEEEAAAHYRQRLAEIQTMEAEAAQRIQALSEEAKSQGYQDGFRMGEEKAELQVRQNASEIFGHVSELVRELSALKHLILENVQENFYELCQAMAEALIKREFNIHPETFVAVLRRAIDEAVEPGKFKIKLHPETFDRVAQIADASLKETLVRDPEMTPGDFKIESSLSVVDVNVGKMIADLLAKADLNLYDQTEKAS